MFEHRDPSRCWFRTYEVEADGFDLHEGDGVAPGLIIGKEVKSGETIKAFYCGHIATVYFNPMNESYLVMIYLTQGGEEKRILEPQTVCKV